MTKIEIFSQHNTGTLETTKKAFEKEHAALYWLNSLGYQLVSASQDIRWYQLKNNHLAKLTSL